MVRLGALCHRRVRHHRHAPKRAQPRARSEERSLSNLTAPIGESEHRGGLVSSKLVAADLAVITRRHRRRRTNVQPEDCLRRSRSLVGHHREFGSLGSSAPVHSCIDPSLCLTHMCQFGP